MVFFWVCNGDSSKSVKAESMFHFESASGFGMVGKHDLSLARDTARLRVAYNPQGILSSLSPSRATQGVSPRLTLGRPASNNESLITEKLLLGNEHLET